MEKAVDIRRCDARGMTPGSQDRSAHGHNPKSSHSAATSTQGQGTGWLLWKERHNPGEINVMFAVVRVLGKGVGCIAPADMKTFHIHGLQKKTSTRYIASMFG